MIEYETWVDQVWKCLTMVHLNSYLKMVCPIKMNYHCDYHYFLLCVNLMFEIKNN